MSFYLICYDITEDRRRDRCARTLLDYGKRVQKSVFECHLDQKLLLKMRGEIWKLINPQQDSVRLYSLCKRCQEGVDLVGLGPPTDDPFSGLTLL